MKVLTLASVRYILMGAIPAVWLMERLQHALRGLAQYTKNLDALSTSEEKST
jgi:hypothetical protein